MKSFKFNILLSLAGAVFGTMARADVIDTSAGLLQMDFVTISGSSNPDPTEGLRGYVAYDYRISKYEVTNSQWDMYISARGKQVGAHPGAWDEDSYFTGDNIPANNISWYEAAHYVNWLNEEAGYLPAYNFDDQGNIYLWEWFEAANDGQNLMRNRYAFYFLPSFEEWTKAAYWNGSELQWQAAKTGETIFQGDGRSGSGWNYGSATDPAGPWNVGSGSEELNGTYDMAGNVSEFSEGSYHIGCESLGGKYYELDCVLFSVESVGNLEIERDAYGFRVASQVPEPCSMILLSAGSLYIFGKKKR